MKFKSLLLIATAAIGTAVAAFELGKSDAIIYCNAKNQVYAKELSFYLNKVFGKK